MKPTPSPQSQQRWDEEIIKILRRVGSLSIEYPSELLASRRAAFILQVQQQGQDRVENRLSSTEQFVQHFESLKFARADYPAELLAARRAAFIELIEQHGRAEIPEELPEHQEISQLFKSLKSVEAEYPSNLMAARRAAFKYQIAQGGRISVLEALRSSIRNLFLPKIKMRSMPTMNMMRTSLVITVFLMLAVFVGSLLRNREQISNSPSPQTEIAQPGIIFTTTGTADAAPVVCKQGYLPPLCLVKEFDKSQDLSFLGNGAARPAVAKDTLPGYSGVHKPSYVNDGLYGPGASWISNSPYSWIKIDLGKTATIPTRSPLAGIALVISTTAIRASSSLLWQCLITCMQMAIAAMITLNIPRSSIRNRLVSTVPFRGQKRSRRSLNRSWHGLSRSSSQMPGLPLMKSKCL
jgi:hypothetical protein